MSRGGAFNSLFCPERRVSVHNDCPRGEGFCSLQVLSRGFVPGGMVLDEIDTCITPDSSANSKSGQCIVGYPGKTCINPK